MADRRPRKTADKEPAAPEVPAAPQGTEGVVSFEEITPEIAQEWMTHNLHNRPLRERTVSTLVAAIKRGEWVVNGDTIRFDTDGVLIDGQHRLVAVIKSGKSISSYVIRGLPPVVQETIDIGNHRGYHDILALRGETHAVGISSVLVWCFRIETLQIRTMKRKPSNGEKDAILARYPQIRESVIKTSNWGKYIPIPKSVMGALHWQLSLIDEEQADFFFNRIADGIALEAGDPILLLRNTLNTWGRGRDRVEDYVKYAFCVFAWNLWRSGQKRQVLAWKRHTMPIPDPK